MNNISKNNLEALREKKMQLILEKVREVDPNCTMEDIDNLDPDENLIIAGEIAKKTTYSCLNCSHIPYVSAGEIMPECPDCGCKFWQII